VHITTSSLLTLLAFPPAPLWASLHLPICRSQHAQLPHQLLVCGASANLGKLLLLDTQTGTVRLGSVQDHMHAEPASRSIVGTPGGRGVSDSMLVWVEEWVRRLEAGWYEVADLGIDRRRRAPGISLFPVAPPHAAWSVTRGLEVRQ
jgi:hypothetical protein